MVDQTKSAGMESFRPLAGRRAVITGGARGLGRAIAQRLSDAGAQVSVVDLAEAIAAAPTLPDFWERSTIDFGSPEAEQQMAELAASLGSVDILVANAGIVPPWRGIAALDMAEWEAVFRVNVGGVALALKCFAPQLERSGNGSAILMASINAYRAHPSQALYTASKHAVLGLMRAAALDLGPKGVRVNALAPGPVATEALVGRIEVRHGNGGPSPDNALAAFVNETALGRLAGTEDIADAALYLASDLSHSVTGVLLPVEGGLS